uniref:Uncharacterized protein n=1 Tax=Ascaris lumbricoides TaxID=6252 RepID=A0A0M3HYG4_ASCLU
MIFHCLFVLLPLTFAENLVLYYPVNPHILVPRSQQSFEKNAPPRVWSRDPDAPSAGIVFINETNKKSPQKQSGKNEQLQNERKSEAKKIAPTTRSRVLTTTPPRRITQTVVPSAAKFPSRDYEFVDVVDDDLDYSVYDSDKINEKVKPASALKKPLKVNVAARGARRIIKPILARDNKNIVGGETNKRNKTPVGVRARADATRFINVGAALQPHKNIR